MGSDSVWPRKWARIIASYATSAYASTVLGALRHFRRNHNPGRFPDDVNFTFGAE